MRGSRLIATIAVALLLFFAASFVAQGFLHTDDGCAVETHCSSCRWASTVNAVFVHVPLPAQEPARRLAATAPRLLAPQEPDGDVPATRGPPA
jgi:hypothetical protein